METLNLTLSHRAIIGKKVRTLRKEGIVPVHLFGKGETSQALQIDAGSLRKILPKAGANVPIMVTVEGQKGENTCFIREVQRHPITSEFLHVDFLNVDVSKTIRVEVPIILDGQAPAVDNMGGILLQIAQTLPVQALPLEVPAAFHLDASTLEDFEKSLRVSDIELADGVSILRDENDMVARVVPPRIEEEEAVDEGDEMGEGMEGELGEGGTPDDGGQVAGQPGEVE